jgi:hypothetical protein
MPYVIREAGLPPYLAPDPPQSRAGSAGNLGLAGDGRDAFPAGACREVKRPQTAVDLARGSGG